MGFLGGSAGRPGPRGSRSPPPPRRPRPTARRRGRLGALLGSSPRGKVRAPRIPGSAHKDQASQAAPRGLFAFVSGLGGNRGVSLPLYGPSRYQHRGRISQKNHLLRTSCPTGYDQLIHPSAWKWCSPKSVSRILHRASWKVRKGPVRDTVRVEDRSQHLAMPDRYVGVRITSPHQGLVLQNHPNSSSAPC
jgi:hypothetical protein